MNETMMNKEHVFISKINLILEITDEVDFEINMLKTKITLLEINNSKIDFNLDPKFLVRNNDRNHNRFIIVLESHHIFAGYNISNYEARNLFDTDIYNDSVVYLLYHPLDGIKTSYLNYVFCYI